MFSEIQSALTENTDNATTVEILKSLRDFKSVTLTLQNISVTLVEPHVLFRESVLMFTAMEARLSQIVVIVENDTFGSTIIAIRRGYMSVLLLCGSA